MRILGVLLSAVLLMATMACQSTKVQVPTAPIGPSEKSLGKTSADSLGLMLFGFIPIRQNERFVDAYKKAVQSVGGTRLTDVTISERWWWGYVINGYVFKVEGTAVGNK
jgi:hypothetical protein